MPLESRGCSRVSKSGKGRLKQLYLPEHSTVSTKVEFLCDETRKPDSASTSIMLAVYDCDGWYYFPFKNTFVSPLQPKHPTAYSVNG